MSVTIRRVVAKVYQCDGRRYFTKRAAVWAKVKALKRERCDCSKTVREYGHAEAFPCKYHDYKGGDNEWLCKLDARLIRFISRQAVISAAGTTGEQS